MEPRVVGTPQARSLSVLTYGAHSMHMFDWIFFAIMIPTPALLAWDMYVHRKDAQRERSAMLGERR